MAYPARRVRCSGGFFPALSASRREGMRHPAAEPHAVSAGDAGPSLLGGALG